MRPIALLLAMSVGGVSSAGAHDFERTRVALSFGADGSFVLDVANDPDWLLLRLEPYAGDLAPGQVPPARTRLGSPTREERDLRLHELAPAFLDRVVLFVDGREVRPVSVDFFPSSANDPRPLVSYRLRGRMPPTARVLRWYYGLVVDPYPLTVHRADGRTVTEWIVAGDAWSSAVDLTGQFQGPSRLALVGQYFRLGYTHILPRGVDHMLFVLGLFLLSLRWRPILAQVTTFTIAHSLTLGLTLYGVVSLSPRVVEPLIALSIAYVAVENLVTSELRAWRLTLVFLFGLLHGMGFAGILRDLGLPRSELLTALLSFNLGVEAGQLTVIAGAAALVVAYRHRPWYHRLIVVPASLAIAVVGVSWTIARVL